MMKIVLPAMLALGGLGAGVGAGMALKPAPLASASACGPSDSEAHGEAPRGEAEHDAAGPADAPHSGSEDGKNAPADCPEVAHAPAHDAEFETVSLDKPFVVPLFGGDEVVGMVVMSLSVEVAYGQSAEIVTLQPRLRDKFLAAMFRHANSGGFEGSFTDGRKMADLKAALLAAAREVVPAAGVGEVLVTEIVRQDV